MSQSNIQPFNSNMLSENKFNRLTLKISYSLLKMYAKLSKNYPVEVCAMHSIEFTGEFFEVLPITAEPATSPIFIPKQEATKVTTRRDPIAYISMPTTFRFNCEVHTHPMDSTEPSFTDIENFNDWSKNCNDYLIFIIISHSSISAFLYTYRGLVTKKLEVIVDMAEQEDLYTTYLPIFKERVTQTAPATSLYNGEQYSINNLYSNNNNYSEYTHPKYYSEKYPKDYSEKYLKDYLEDYPKDCSEDYLKDYLEDYSEDYSEDYPKDYSEYGSADLNSIALLKKVLGNNLQELVETRNFIPLITDEVYSIPTSLTRSYDQNYITFTKFMDSFLDLQIEYMPTANEHWGGVGFFEGFQKAMEDEKPNYRIGVLDILRICENSADPSTYLCEVTMHILLIIGFVPTLLPEIVTDLEIGRLKIHDIPYSKKLLSQLRALRSIHNEQL